MKASIKSNAVDGGTKAVFATEVSRSSTKEKIEPILPDQSTPINGQNLLDVVESAKADKQSFPPTQNGDKTPPASTAKEAEQILEHDGERSQKQQQQQPSTAIIKAKSASSALIKPPSSSSTSPSVSFAGVDSPNQSKFSDTGTSATNPLIGDQSNTNATDELDDIQPDDQSTDSRRATPTPIKLSRSTATSNFVRNSLPSRSVNLGHSKSSAYLDRIRASVTATTTTNTTSSFNEQTRDIILSQQPGSQSTSARYTLNCMLDHQHSERCFLANSIDHLQASQMVAANHHRHHNLNNHLPIRSSRQLNALIDPVSHERLIVSTLQHNHGNIQQQQMHNQARDQSAFGVHDSANLTEQQIAHLASLHHQHYYHHLQHMHQLHQLHHQHHLHLHHHRMQHKYKQQQQQQHLEPGNTTDNEQQSAEQDSSLLNKQSALQMQCDLNYSGGSQFYAPSAQLEQVYANTKATTNNNINQLSEYQHRTKLVKSNDKLNQHGSIDLSGQPRIGRLGNTAKIGIVTQQQVQYNHQLSQYTLPQIDEVNGLPTVETASVTQQNGSSRKNQRNALKLSSETITKANQHNLSSNGSPSSSSSSPTSSASSNLSPSSASSSSSINSLSPSSAPLNRSSLRHTTTDCHNRRQFSVERELVNVMPMTAALSRVGSCRSNTRTLPDGSRHLPDVALMQTPVKSQQPSMRTSKILNISQQSSAQLPVQQQHQSISKIGSKQGIDLASIKLSQNLAFASLRAPKCSPNESGVGSSVISNNSKGQISTATAKRPATSSSLERRKQGGNNNATNDDGSNKSSVWFEYGCV